MITTTQLLVGFLILCVLFGCAIGLALAIYAGRKLWIEVKNFVAAISGLKQVLEVLGNAEQMIAGHEKVARAQVKEIERLRNAVDKLAGLFVQVDPKEQRREALIEQNEDEVGKAFDVQELILEHPEYDQEMARQMVESTANARLSMGLE